MDPGAIDAVRKLTKNGWSVIIISNQSAVGRKIITHSILKKIDNKMLAEISKLGGKIQAIYYCPHKPGDNCDCRKPEPGLLLRAKRDFSSIDFASSYLIGDTFKDIEAGKSVGCRTIMVKTGLGNKELRNNLGAKSKPDYVVADLKEAVELILR